MAGLTDVDAAEQLPGQQERKRCVGTQGRGEALVIGKLTNEQRQDDDQRIELFEQRNSCRFNISEPYAAMRDGFDKDDTGNLVSGWPLQSKAALFESM